VMVRNRRSWREAAIVGRLDRGYWRAEYPGGGSGMFKEADIRAYDAKRGANPAKRPGRARATDPKKAPRSRYRIDPEAITAGRLPEMAPVVTSATNPHYQKYFDRLFGLAKAGDWDAVRDYRITGSNSYSKWSRGTARICWLSTLLRKLHDERTRSTGALPRFGGPHEARSHNAPSLVLRCIRLMTVPLSLGSGLPGAPGAHPFALRDSEWHRTSAPAVDLLDD
jgi:hypothetical protein